MKTIKIKEDVRVPGTDVILEKGDIIRVLTPVYEKILKLNEGQFSWFTSDTDQQIVVDGPPYEIWMKGHDGKVFHQRGAYEGYGVFGGKDFYEYLAELNGERSDRDIGIDLLFDFGGRFGDEEEAERKGLKIPRLFSNRQSINREVENFPPPRSDPNQGWEDESWDDDYDDYD